MINRLLKIFFIFPMLTYAARVELEVVDDRGQPVVRAATEVAFATYSGTGERVVKGSTDSSGKFLTRGSSNHSIYIKISNEGHYPARMDRLPVDQDHILTVVLPRVINPRPLYYLRRTSDNFPRVPSFDTWYEFDMKMCDWVAPYGTGEIGDFQVRISRKFTKFYTSERNIEEARRRFPDYSEDDFRRIWGDWDLVFDIAFLGRGSGVVESSAFYTYSKMPMPHSAPQLGYQPTWSFNYTNRATGEKRDNVGHFVKTRVVYDEAGNEISANYAKFIGDPWVGVQGEMLFEYYFNPDANDRNLEYDGKTNLADAK
jgi:hypothetical protein